MMMMVSIDRIGLLIIIIVVTSRPQPTDAYKLALELSPFVNADFVQISVVCQFHC
jgi:hypothetical protein